MPVEVVVVMTMMAEVMAAMAMRFGRTGACRRENKGSTESKRGGLEDELLHVRSPGERVASASVWSFACSFRPMFGS